MKGRSLFLCTSIWSCLQNRAHRLRFPHISYICHHADANVVCGEYVKRHLLPEGVAPERIFLALHAIDDTEYNRQAEENTRPAPQMRLGIFEEQEVVQYVGRLERSLIELEAFSVLNREDAILVLV
jgi:hypothetical protein